MQTLHALVDAGSDMDCTDGSGTTLLALAGETQVKGSVLAFDLCVPLPPCRRHRHSLRPSPVQTPRRSIAIALSMFLATRFSFLGADFIATRGCVSASRQSAAAGRRRSSTCAPGGQASLFGTQRPGPGRSSPPGRPSCRCVRHQRDDATLSTLPGDHLRHRLCALCCGVRERTAPPFLAVLPHEGARHRLSFALPPPFCQRLSFVPPLAVPQSLQGRCAAALNGLTDAKVCKTAKSVSARRWISTALVHGFLCLSFADEAPLRRQGGNCGGRELWTGRAAAGRAAGSPWALSTAFPRRFHCLALTFPRPFHCLSTARALPVSQTVPLCPCTVAVPQDVLVELDSRTAEGLVGQSDVASVR